MTHDTRMMLLVVGAVAFTASELTFVSGFGLGTLLMPVLARWKTLTFSPRACRAAP